MKRHWKEWIAVGLPSVAFLCVLGFYGIGSAAPQSTKQPFGSAVTQRTQIITELKSLNGLLKEQNRYLKDQNALLRSGRLKVQLKK